MVFVAVTLTTFEAVCFCLALRLLNLYSLNIHTVILATVVPYGFEFANMPKTIAAVMLYSLELALI